MLIALEFLRTFILLLTLLYAAWLDYKTREVPDRVWLISAVPVLALMVLELAVYSPHLLVYYPVCIGITAGASIAVFYLNFFGGADAKALIFMALAMPFMPMYTSQPVLPPSPVALFLFPLAGLVNTLFFAVLAVAYMFVVNLKDIASGVAESDAKLLGATRFLLMFVARRETVAALKKKQFWIPLEQKQPDGSTKISLLPDYDKRDEILAAADEQKVMWATPGLPMLVFMFVGVVSVLWGADFFSVLRFLFFGQ